MNRGSSHVHESQPKCRRLAKTSLLFHSERNKKIEETFKEVTMIGDWTLPNPKSPHTQQTMHACAVRLCSSISSVDWKSPNARLQEWTSFAFSRDNERGGLPMQQGAVSGRQILCPKQLQLQLASSSFRRSMGEASRIDSAKE